MKSMRAYGLAFVLAFGGNTLLSPAAGAQTQTETIVAEQRTSVSVRVTPEALQALLPAGWKPATGAPAPTVSLTFMDRKLALKPDGTPLFSGQNRMLVISAQAVHTTRGETRTMIIGGYSADPEGVPGAYGVYGAGTIDLSRTETVRAMQSDRVEESWTVRAADGGVLKVSVAFDRKTPKATKFDFKIYSAANPDFFRMYKGLQTTDSIRVASAGADASAVTLDVSGGMLVQLLGSHPKALSASNSPFYMRDTFVE